MMPKTPPDRIRTNDALKQSPRVKDASHARLRNSPDRFITLTPSPSQFHISPPPPSPCAARTPPRLSPPRGLQVDAASDSAHAHQARLVAALGYNQQARVLRTSKTAHSATSSPGMTTATNDADLPRQVRPVALRASRMLDAPELRDDFYCAPLAFSANDQLAVCLDDMVYLWSMGGEDTNGEAQMETRALSQDDYAPITCVDFCRSASGILALGRADGAIKVWATNETRPRLIAHHRFAVTCLAWRPPQPAQFGSQEYLLVGFDNGVLVYYRVCWTEGASDMHALHRLLVHQQQVCGLAWAPDGSQWASGGNDNMVALFDAAHPQQARHRWRHHAAVKAIAFCPWQKNLLVTGGGSLDRKIRFYHTLSGTKVAEIHVKAQVTALIWSRTSKEILATFGFANPSHAIRLAVFSWPQLTQLVSVSWHLHVRSLHAVQTAQGGQVVVAGSDETLRFYDLWEKGESTDLQRKGVFGSDIIELLEGVDLGSMRRGFIR